jgi:uncharacterized cupredoxin-like copper-binding protein
MAMEERGREPAATTRAESKDAVAVVAVLVASVAMVAALVAVGLAVRADDTRNKATTLAAGSATALGATASAPVTPLAVTERNFAIAPAQTSLPAGLVDLAVTDRGPSAHEMLIFQTDLPADKLPLGPDGRVDEAGDGVLKVFDSGDNIDVGTTKTFHIALAAGHYVMVCNLPGHYLAGMHTAFTVTGTPEVGSVVPAPSA